MASTVIHKQVYRAVIGGTVNTTLCGRMQIQPDGMNVGAAVTCKLCLRILADPGHWRNRSADDKRGIIE